jgi:hypothetical protein
MTKRYRKIATENVSMDRVEITDDLEGIDSQIRCVLGDIENRFNKSGYNEREAFVPPCTMYPRD